MSLIFLGASSDNGFCSFSAGTMRFKGIVVVGAPEDWSKLEGPGRADRACDVDSAGYCW